MIIGTGTLFINLKQIASIHYQVNQIELWLTFVSSHRHNQDGTENSLLVNIVGWPMNSLAFNREPLVRTLLQWY